MATKNKTLAFRPKPEDYKAFEKICKTVGVTKYEALQNLFMAFVDMYNDEPELAKQVIRK